MEFGRARKKGKERLQGRYCFLHFLRSDSEFVESLSEKPNNNNNNTLATAKRWPRPFNRGGR